MPDFALNKEIDKGFPMKTLGIFSGMCKLDIVV